MLDLFGDDIGNPLLAMAKARILARGSWSVPIFLGRLDGV